MLEVFDAPASAVPETRAATRPAHPSAVPPAAGTRGGVVGRIEARHLTFSYPGRDTPALLDVSFELEAGQTLALVGPTGSGKSTLVELLPRLREPARGMLWIDGVDVCDMPLEALRASMAIVPQEPFLFSDTVGGNIAFGLNQDWGSQPVRATVRDAAVAAALAPDIARFPRGYDTVVGERGITLSGGQRQRVAIARALVADAPILVLDDALSAVDTATEEAILKGLRQVRQSRTCLIVSHRVSTVRDADLILVLANGRIVERGTHDALVRLGGLYADMNERQRLEEEVAHE
jgi:ATP-binding cassette subfamily B protein